MRLILWNISYQNNIKPIIDLIKAHVNDDTFMTLLEVMPHDYDVLYKIFSNDYILITH